MKAASLKELKTELLDCSRDDLLKVCLELAKFKKENKELLTYMLLEASDEEGYVASVKEEVAVLFEEMNKDSYFYMKKTIRKILRILKTHIRYSKNKETEVELLLYFCEELKELRPSIKNSTILKNLYNRQLLFIEKKIEGLHEDLQYEYSPRLENLS